MQTYETFTNRFLKNTLLKKYTLIRKKLLAAPLLQPFKSHLLDPVGT